MATDARIGVSVVVAALAAAAQYLNGCKVGLFTDLAIPDDWWLIGSYTQPVNSGYALQSPNFILPDDPTPPVVHAISSNIAWEADPAGVDDMVIGWFLFDEELDQVVLVLLYGSVQPFIRAGPFWIDADISVFAAVFE
ncbi:MAG: hypothetical protein EHM18_03285 [Acidobacteria bacterium]|nr:MAG: hypothetical protein EHM18_03285 [Acidobacteriota bacterium]